MKLHNIEFSIDGNGQIAIGRIGPVHCAAVASDEDQSLAMLVRREGETLSDLLVRLDSAIASAWEDEEFIDEVTR